MRKLYSTTLFTILIVISFYFSLEAAEVGLVKNAIEAKGKWRKGIVLERKVIFTDKKGDISEVEFEVPKDGYYHLYTYVYHNWRTCSPFIYFIGEDSKRVQHKGYMSFEKCWYLKKDSCGRWLMHSPNSNFFYLPQGSFTLRFWLEGKVSNWDQKETKIEDIVAIENFFLTPVIFTKKEVFSMSTIEPEKGIVGSWVNQSYTEQFGAGIISTSSFGKSASLDFYIPSPGKYLLAISIYAYRLNKIEIVLKGDNFYEKFICQNQLDRPLWKLNFFGPFYFNKGKYFARFKDLSVNVKRSQIAVDYLLFIPHN